MEPNPYLAPTTIATPLETGLSSDEEIRRQCINRESTIRTLSALYILGGVIGLIAGASLISQSGASPRATSVWTGLFCVALSLLGLANGTGLRALKPWARVLATLQACVGLLAFPIGTLINALIISAFWSNPSKTIFSEDYKRIIAATPHVKVKTSKVTIAVLIILAVAVLALVGVIIFGR
ncbi:hypothetical protein [Luteolibacter sp. LG18]|uniref:hypothetical protein n=1 Tax=Luteolibacter sp. LG18 TaxID=2819286 RepID=UPI002B2F7179|nr:hypothetical protein llg_21880 [Luteolibacter sp. LG18]